MRNWKTFVRSLTDRPAGFGFDGRVMSLSLSAAMDAQRRREVAEVEDYLRDDAATPRGTNASA